MVSHCTIDQALTVIHDKIFAAEKHLKTGDAYGAIEILGKGGCSLCQAGLQSCEFEIIGHCPDCPGRDGPCYAADHARTVFYYLPHEHQDVGAANLVLKLWWRAYQNARQTFKNDCKST